MQFHEIVDGFVYLALTYTHIPLPNLYNKYIEYLCENHIQPPKQYALIIKIAEESRNSSSEIKTCILQNIRIPVTLDKI